MASQLSSAQASTFKAFIAADPVLSQKDLNNPDDRIFIADEMNKQAAPDYYVWRTAMTEQEILENGMDFTLIDGLTQGKRDEWSNFLFKFGQCNPSKPNIRAGIIDVWTGTAPKLAVQLGIWGHAQKKATRGEKLFATGNGVAATVANVANNTGPSLTALLLPMTSEDVEAARVAA